MTAQEWQACNEEADRSMCVMVYGFAAVLLVLIVGIAVACYLVFA